MCLIDTVSGELKAKIGDGKTEFKDLPYFGETQIIISGYYNSTFDCFFKEATETNIIPRQVNKLYQDIPTSEIYSWDGTHHVKRVCVARKDTNVPGLVKLSSQHGLNEDMVMTQKAVTEAISEIDLILDDEVEECFRLNKPW